MNPIEILITFFLLKDPACYAWPAEAARLGQQEYQILSWSCNEHSWKAWQQKCPQGYYGRLFYLQEQKTQLAIYLNRFGEVQIGYGAQLEDMYVPLCGS